MVEVGHSHIRRVVKNRVQGHQINFEDLCLQWVNMQFSRPAADDQSQSECTAIAVASDTGAKKRKRGGGGEYRQYMHEQATNDFAAANTAWADYKANGTEQERLRLQEEGRAATQRHRDGAEATYGPTNRMVVRKKKTLIESDTSASPTRWRMQAQTSTMWSCNSLMMPRMSARTREKLFHSYEQFGENQVDVKLPELLMTSVSLRNSLSKRRLSRWRAWLRIQRS